MKLAQRARACPACGRREPVDALWCGDCGAPLTARSGPTVLRLDEAPAPVDTPPRAGTARRIVGAAGAALLAVTMAGLFAEPAVVGDPDLLGRIDETSGRSSLLPPADDLQLLWRRPVELGGPRAGPPALLPLADDVLVDGRTTSARAPVRWPTDAVPAPDGTVLLIDGTDVVRADVATGGVRGRAPLAGPAGWQPTGHAEGWVAGAAVLRSVDGVLGAVEPDGTVRWVGDPAWTWDGTGAGTDWLVVTVAGDVVDRVVVVDGRDGTVHRDVGPVGAVHAPAVHGDTVAWVDPFGGRDLGLGQPVEVHGLRLDGTGRVWTVTDLPPTTGEPRAVGLTAVDDALVVHYWGPGQATVAVWLDAGSGARLGEVTVSGTGVTEDGWPVASVVTEGIVHVSPVRGEVRFVDRGGRVRWSQPARAGEGVVAAGDAVLLRTPFWRTPTVGPDVPRGSLLQARVRLLDATTGALRWDLVAADVPVRRLVAVLAGHVGVTDATGPVAASDQLWLDLGSGRRSAGAGLVADLLGDDGAVAQDAVLLGRVRVGPTVRPVFGLPDGRLVGVDPDAVGSTLQQLLAPVAPVTGGPPPTVLDGGLAVRVGTASVVATAAGREVWRVASPVVLDPALAVLTSELLVVGARDGSLHAWDRRDGTPRWVHDTDVVTALTAGGDELVAGTVDGRVLVLDATGGVLQDVRVGGAPVDDLAVVAGQVVVVTGADVAGLGRGAFFVEPDDRVELP